MSTEPVQLGAIVRHGPVIYVRSVGPEEGQGGPVWFRINVELSAPQANVVDWDTMLEAGAVPLLCKHCHQPIHDVARNMRITRDWRHVEDDLQFCIIDGRMTGAHPSEDALEEYERVHV